MSHSGLYSVIILLDSPTAANSLAVDALIDCKVKSPVSPENLKIIVFYLVLQASIINFAILMAILVAIDSNARNRTLT